MRAGQPVAPGLPDTAENPGQASWTGGSWCSGVSRHEHVGARE